MKLAAYPLLIYLVDPFRRYLRAVYLGEKGVVAEGSAKVKIELQDIAAPPRTTTRFLSSSLTIDLSDGTKVVLPAVKAPEARAFSEAVEKAWSNFNLEQLGKF